MQAIGAQRQCQVGIVVNANGETGVGNLMANYRGQHKEDGDVLRGFKRRRTI
jgi:hypothetical protein